MDARDSDSINLSDKESVEIIIGTERDLGSKSIDNTNMILAKKKARAINLGEAEYQNYLSVPLYWAAQKGDWKRAKKIIDRDNTIVSARIAQGDYTALHVATGARHVDFVRELVRIMDQEDLALLDARGNTAFSLAVAAGSLEIAKIMIQKDPSLTVRVGSEGRTPLFYAALFGHQKMAMYLYSQPTTLEENLDWVFFACINTGLYGLASIILKQHPEFALKRDPNKKTALHLFAQKPSALEHDDNRTQPQVCMRFLIKCIPLKIHEICAELAQNKLEDEQFNTILHLLAQNSLSASTTQNPASIWKRLQQFLALKALEIYPELVLELDGSNIKDTLRKILTGGHTTSAFGSPDVLKRTRNPAHALVKDLWDKVGEKVSENNDLFKDLLQNPSHLLFDAVESGNSKFVAQLIHDCPGLIWEKDGNGHTIIHAAVLHRHASIYNLIHEIGMIKDVIVASTDNNANSILHLAAELAPTSQLNKLSGAAFQMQWELLWFEEVKKIILPSDIETKNSEGKTAQELFTARHATLLKDGEKWMNETARSCTIVSTLIAGALFAAGIAVSFGGSSYKDERTSGHHFRKASFRIFIISDAIAFFLSLTATLMFFAILTSRYAERDFLRSLPLKLMAGLVFLLFSIIAMMVAFSTASFIVYGRKDFLPYFVTGCAVLPVALYTVLLFPLTKDVIASTFCSKSLFKKTEPVI